MKAFLAITAAWLTAISLHAQNGFTSWGSPSGYTNAQLSPKTHLQLTIMAMYGLPTSKLDWGSLMAQIGLYLTHKIPLFLLTK
jgi:hypothetical protein